MTIPEFYRWQTIPGDFSGFCIASDDFYYCNNGIIMSPPSGGPAFITEDQRRIWVKSTDTFEPDFGDKKKQQRVYKNHRLDGPAKIYVNGDCEFWIDGDEYGPEEFWNHPLVIKNKLESVLQLLL